MKHVKKVNAEMLSAEPVVGADMAPPVRPPRPGEVIIGYETFQNEVVFKPPVIPQCQQG